jgi:hypothetical protein
MDQPSSDRILVAQLTGTARYHARWRQLTDDEQNDAVAELADLAAGRADLLAEVAGLQIGCHEGELDEPIRRQAADLLLKAGADTALIPCWIAEGRRRARNARQIPYTGLSRPPPGAAARTHAWPCLLDRPRGRVTDCENAGRATRRRPRRATGHDPARMTPLT